MKELKKEIWKLRRERFANRFIAVFEVILGIVGTPFELMFKLNPMILTFKALDHEPIDTDIDALQLFDDARDDFEEAKEISEEIRDLKEEVKEKKKQIIPDTIDNTEIIEYTKSLIAKCSTLSIREQKAIIKKIKRILLEYAKQYLKCLKTNQDITTLTTSTINKLSIIEQAINTRLNIKSNNTPTKKISTK